jgi:hypothetical protein
MAERVVFYQLTKKFVNDQDKIPEEARQIVYYSLAIGHHVGVMDCFDSLMELPLEEYESWIQKLEDGSGRRKMEGLLKFGEIEVNASHVSELLPVFDASLPMMSPQEKEWTLTLLHSLLQMQEEPAYYLMVRKRS